MNAQALYTHHESTVCQSKTTNDSGIVLRGIRRRATENAVPALLLHGFLDNCFSFLRLMSHLDQVDSYALDLPGHGKSDPIATGPKSYSPDDFTATLESYLRRNHSQPVVLIGHSMGAAIACSLAAQAPHLVAALVLLDQLSPMGHERATFFERLKRFASRDPGVGASYRSRIAAIDARVAKGVPRRVAIDLAERGLEFVGGGYHWAYDPRLLAPSSGYRSEQEIASDLRELPHPVLFVESSQDFSREKARQRGGYLHLFADIRHCICPGSHHFHAEHPELTARSIQCFLYELGLIASPVGRLGGTGCGCSTSESKV